MAVFTKVIATINDATPSVHLFRGDQINFSLVVAAGGGGTFVGSIVLEYATQADTPSFTVSQEWTGTFATGTIVSTTFSNDVGQNIFIRLRCRTYSGNNVTATITEIDTVDTNARLVDGKILGYGSRTLAEFRENGIYSGPGGTGSVVCGNMQASTITITGTSTLLSSYASFSAAITALGSSTAVLLIDAAASIVDNISVPSNITLSFVNGNVATVSAGKTLTINGDVRVDARRQIFGTTGTVTFAEGSVLEIFPEWWGAVPNGVVDCTSAFNNALAQRNHLIRVSDGIYKCNDPISTTVRIKLVGNGTAQSIIKVDTTGVENAFTISPLTGGNNSTHYVLQDFAIEPVTTGTGNYGIHINLGAGTGVYFSNSTIERVKVGDFGNYGLVLDNGSQVFENGFFTLTIARCWSYNGIRGIKIGDSITIRENTVTEGTAGKVGIHTSHLSGARQVVISENNITTRGGAIYCEQPYGVMIYNNQCEHPSYLGDYTNPESVNGMIVLKDPVSCQIRDNTVSPNPVQVPPVGITPADYAVRLTGVGYRNYVNGNEIYKGALGHVEFETGIYLSELGEQNSYDVAAVNLVGAIDANGINFGFDYTPTLLLNWVAFDAGTAPRFVRHGNMVHVRGSIKSATVGDDTPGNTLFTLPVAARPKTTQYRSVASNNGAYIVGAVTVDLNGDVKIQAGNKIQLSVDFSFEAA